MLLSRDISQGIRLETMRRDFVANVSHELRTPLTVLVGFLETVRELKLDPGRSRDYLNLMAEQSKRMQRIIDDLLTLSTLESAPEARRRVEMLLLADQNGDCASAGRQRITLDRAGFRPASEPKSRSARATPLLYPFGRGSAPHLAEPHRRAEFTVEDTGVGIDADTFPALASVSAGSWPSRGQNTGLGLAIVKRALARYQATLGSRHAWRGQPVHRQVSCPPGVAPALCTRPARLVVLPVVWALSSSSRPHLHVTGGFHRCVLAAEIGNC
jgi:two-component system phosphate regulon sensor histidine kinase PhoR